MASRGIEEKRGRMLRLRARFSRGPEIKFISHLDIMRLWVRALNRAGIQLAFSEGFNPHPRISLAAPLALGVTSEAELLDVYCEKQIPHRLFQEAVSRQLPAGIALLQVIPVSPFLPALPAQLRFAEYRVEVATHLTQGEVEKAMDALLSLEHLPWQHHRDTGLHHYDLRPLIDDLWLVECRGGLCVLGMRLRCGSQGAGRPEQVTAALGIAERPRLMHRTRLIMETK